MPSLLRSVVLVLLSVLPAVWPVAAQAPRYSARAQMQAPQALAMGNTAVALPSPRTTLFYNPAHLTHLRHRRAPVVLLGLQAAFSPNISDQLAFYNDRLEPALDAGLETLSDAERAALYTDAVRLGQRRTFAGGTALLPSFVMDRGRYGVGGGIFVDGRLHYRVLDTGEAPTLDFGSRVDAMVVAAGALDLAALGLPGLSAGLTARYTQRYVTLKNQPFPALDDAENLYVLGSDALGFDVGIHYAAPLASRGTLHLGAALYDAVGTGFSYGFRTYYVKNGARDEATLRAEEALAEQRLRLRRSYRAGAAYATPPLGGLPGAVLTVDYFYHPSLATGPALADHLRAGAALHLLPEVTLRAGLNQGRAAAGATLALPLVTLDYAYHHVQLLGLPGGWTHTVQVALGSF